MADHTHIEWTEATWNPITGCSLKSPGCAKCYAMKLAGTRLRDHPSRAGLTTGSKAGPVWTGEVRFNKQWLDQPLRWERPRMIFVCAHGDLFHESVPDEWIDRVFAVMALAPQHTFQVLTKRADRMREYCTAMAAGERSVISAGKGLAKPGVLAQRMSELAKDNPACSHTGPLPNVWLGVSVEDQARADERIPHLLATPAAVRWISAEPLLGPLDLRDFLYPVPAGRVRYAYHLGGDYPVLEGVRPMLDWVVCGGESGAGARPMHPDWARSLRDQCAAADVPFFFKQWGEYHPADQRKDSAQIEAMGDMSTALRSGAAHVFDDQWTWRIGKKRAGRLLDGQLHDAMPQVRG